MPPFLLLYAILILSSFPAVAHQHAATSIEQAPLEKVSERIYVVHGPHALPNPVNRGFMNNPGAILTDNGVIIVDPGSSAAIAQQLLEKVRALSDKPVIAVFNTHVHGDHWLGNAGILERHPQVPIYAHKRAIARLESGEAQVWLDRFMRMTEGAIAATRIQLPTIGLDGGEELRLDGVTLRIHHTGPAHTDTDIMIEVVEDKALFFGDVLVVETVPNSVVPQDAHFMGTLKAQRAMLDRDIDLYIPGHGRSGGRQLPLASIRFLEALQAAVTRYYQQGLLDFEMKEPVTDDLAEFKTWNNFDELGRVISQVYQEVERENF